METAEINRLKKSKAIAKVERTQQGKEWAGDFLAEWTYSQIATEAAQARLFFCDHEFYASLRRDPIIALPEDVRGSVECTGGTPASFFEMLAFVEGFYKEVLDRWLVIEATV